MAVVINVYGKADLGQIQKAEKQLAGMKREVASQGTVWGRMGSAISSTGAKIAAGLAAAGITRWLMQSVKAAQEAEVTTAKLNRAVTAAGTPWITYEGQMKKVVDAQSQLSAYSGGQLKGALTALTQTTGSSGKALNLLALTTDLARGKNMDLVKAGQLVGKVAMGNTSALSRYGIVVKKGSTATEALAQLQGRFSGQAKGYGDSSAGAQEKFNNALRKLQVTIGTAVLPSVTALMGRLVGILDKFQALPGPVKNVIIGIAGVATAALLLAPFMSALISVVSAMKLAAVATKVWTAAQWLWNAAMSANPVGLIIIAIVALVGIFVLLWKKCGWFRNFWIAVWKVVKSQFAAVWPVIKAVGRKILSGLTAVWRGIAAAVKWFWGWAGPYIRIAVKLWWTSIKLQAIAIYTIVKWVWQKVYAAVKWFWGWAGPYIKGQVKIWWTIIKGTLEAIKPVFSVVWPIIKSVVSRNIEAIKAVVHTIQALVAFVRGVWNAIRSATSAAWNAIKNTVSTLAHSAANALRSAFSPVAGFLSGVWSRIRDGASSALTKVVGFFRGLGAKIRSALSGAASWLAGVGQKIVDGLWNGLTSAWRTMLSKFSALVNMLPGAVKRVLGISSPSKVFAGLGRQIGAGLALGMEQSRQMVAQAAARTAGAATFGATGGYGSPSFAGTGGPRSVAVSLGGISVSVGEGAGSPKQIATAVRDGISPTLERLARELSHL